MVELTEKKFVEKGGGMWRTNTTGAPHGKNRTAPRNLTCTTSNSAGVSPASYTSITQTKRKRKLGRRGTEPDTRTGRGENSVLRQVVANEGRVETRKLRVDLFAQVS